MTNLEKKIRRLTRENVALKAKNSLLKKRGKRRRLEKKKLKEALVEKDKVNEKLKNCCADLSMKWRWARKEWIDKQELDDEQLRKYGFSPNIPPTSGDW